MENAAQSIALVRNPTAPRGDLVNQFGKPALDECNLCLGDRYRIGPVVCHAPMGQIMHRRPAGKGPGTAQKSLQLLRGGCKGSLAGAGLILSHLRDNLQGGSGWKEAISSVLEVDRTATISSLCAETGLEYRCAYRDPVEALDQGGQRHRIGRDTIRHARSRLLGSVAQFSPITITPAARGNGLQWLSEVLRRKGGRSEGRRPEKLAPAAPIRVP